MSGRPRSRSRIVVLASLVIGCAMLAPAMLAAAPLRLPPPTRATLKDGLTVLVLPNHRLPLVDFLLEVKTGSIADPRGKEGLADLTASLLTQGAGTRTAPEMAEAIAFVGGTLDANAGQERVSISCEVLKKDFATGLMLLHDVTVRPTFPAEEFARKKEEALGALASARDDPSEIADRALLPFLLGEHPLAHPVDGWEASVTSITRDDVVAFHRDLFTPTRAMIAVVGDVDPKAVIAALETAFNDWSAPRAEFTLDYPPLAVSGRREVRLVSRPEATQSQIRLACPGVPRSHPDYFPILVTNTILGGGFTPRLVNEIRVVQGLTYSIDSGFRMQKNAGEYVIATFTKNETLRKTIDETIRVVQRLKSDGPTQAELDKARQYLAGQYPLGLQSPDDLAAHLLDIEFYGLPADYLNTFTDRVNAVTLEDCRRAAKSYFCTDDLKILVVTNPEVGKKALAGLGPLTVTSAR